MERMPDGADVRLKGVARSFGSTRVVDNIDLAAEGGEILALLGPSGCGKTTTLRMIAGLIAPSAGDILIDGRSVIGEPVHRRNLGMLFQNYALFPHLSVAENVAFGLAMRGVSRKDSDARVSEALQLVRLTGMDDRLPASLSGGQQQRVALARALVYRPRVLLLDEPLGALDKKLREAMQIELRQLCNALCLTTIMVTHDQEEALVLADRIAVMRNGRIEQAGTARDIYERPATQFVADFIGSSNFLSAVVTGVAADVTTLATDNGVVLASTLPCAAQTGERVTVAIRPENVTLRRGESTATAPNRLSGPVLRSVFKGQHYVVWIGTADGAEFSCTMPVEDTGHPVPGDVWTAEWPAGRIVIVRE